ncbi:MAG: hypothetical protein ACP5HQ_01380 [Thermoprotei archaeon]
MKGLSSVILFLVLLVMLTAILIPALEVIQSTSVFQYQGELTGFPYSQLQSQELRRIFLGNPQIYYNSSTSPYIELIYKSTPYPINITQVFYYNGSVWKATLQLPIGIWGNYTIFLPSEAFNRPIVIVTGMGNILYLKPNTSTTLISYVK